MATASIPRDCTVDCPGGKSDKSRFPIDLVFAEMEVQARAALVKTLRAETQVKSNFS